MSIPSLSILLFPECLLNDGGLGYGGGGVPGGVSYPSCLLKSFILSDKIKFLDASTGVMADNESGLDLVR